MDEILTTCKRQIMDHGSYDRDSLSVPGLFKGVRLQINPKTGQGWTELIEIDSGICVSLSNYRLSKSEKSVSRLTKTPLQFNILLSGTFDFHLEGDFTHSVHPGDIWVWNNLSENIFRTQPRDHKISGLCLVIPHHIVKNWLEISDCHASQNLEKLMHCCSSPRSGPDQPIFPLARNMPQTNPIMRMAVNLFQIEKNTLYGKLHFEALALQLLSLILTFNFGGTGKKRTNQWKIRAAVDEAVDILREEWDNPPTISALARRVKLNESYLKNGFRTQTGATIGEFVRHLRMTKALELIESGQYSILETALIVGYANPSHFSAVFKNFYGHLPSYYTRIQKN